ARLVVGARRTRTAKGLLAHDRSRRLVVHVEVAGRVAQPVRRTLDRIAVIGDHGTGQRVLGTAIDDVEDLVKALVGIDMDGEDRAEVLGTERVVARIVGQQHGGPYEIAFIVVVFAADG